MQNRQYAASLNNPRSLRAQAGCNELTKLFMSGALPMLQSLDVSENWLDDDGIINLCVAAGGFISHVHETMPHVLRDQSVLSSLHAVDASRARRPLRLFRCAFNGLSRTVIHSVVNELPSGCELRW